VASASLFAHPVLSLLPRSPIVALPSVRLRAAGAVGRAALAARRAEAARASLGCCHLCAHHCGVDRLAGVGGECQAGSTARVFSAQTEVSDELCLGPTFAIALSGCDLRCAFCITGRESWDARAGESLDAMALADRATAALAAGARTIMILGGEPTVFLADALALVARLPETATLVWKTNAHGSAEARALLDGLFDVWVVDYKFGHDDCAARLARVSGYRKTVHENLLWAAREHELIVRHLLMPGHVECCWLPVATWMAENLPGASVSLREGFWPAWKTRRHPEMNRPCTAAEGARARAIAADLALHLIP
jgi:putative pyruvate formate lyase activating enzyme